MAAISGRPDGRLANYIYASGAGGVCRDMRYSAWGLTQEDFAEADLAVKSGEYRGRERLVKTYIHTSSDSAFYGDFNTTRLPSIERSGWEAGDTLWVEDSTGSYNKVSIISVNTSNDYRVTFTPTITNGTRPEGALVVHFRDLISSIAGEYTHTEVFGDPANILQCDDLKDGWVGSWNPIIPDGQTRTFKLSKPAASTTTSIFLTGDQGSSWSYFPAIQLDNTLNERSSSYASNEIAIYQYKTKAKMTEDSVNTPWYPTMNPEVYASSDSFYAASRGRLLKYSLVDGVSGVADYTNGAVQALNLDYKGSFLDPEKALLTTINRQAYLPSHEDIVVDGSESIPAFKALNYNTVENQQGFINYAYTELKYDGTAGDWGDDSKIHIADNQTTMLDENGHTVLVGTARIVEPLGWIKNDK